MKVCCRRLLGVVVVLLAMFNDVSNAFAQDPTAQQAEAAQNGAELIPLTPYEVDIYDESQDDPWDVKLSPKSVAITAVFCIHPDPLRELLRRYEGKDLGDFESGYFSGYATQLWNYTLMNVCEYTTHHVSPFRFNGVMTIELEGSSENYVGPGRHASETIEIVFMRLIVPSSVEYKPDRTLFIAIPRNQIDEDVVWPGI